MHTSLTIPMFVFYLLCCNQSAAQPPIGIRIGAGLSMPGLAQGPDASPEWSKEGRVGFTGGVYTQFPLSKAWMIQPGLQITSKGYKERNTNSTYAFANRYSYLELPLNFVYTSKAEGNGFGVGGGPVIGYLLERQYQSGFLKKIDIGGSVLVSYKVPLGFSVQLQYTHGVLNTIEHTQYMKSLKNRYLALTAGYLF